MICVVLFVITFLTTRERIQPDPKQKVVAARQDFGTLLKNGPWIAMFILTLAHFAVLAMRGGTLFYYFQYYVNQDRLFDLLQTLGPDRRAPATGGVWHYLLNTFGLIVDAKRIECVLGGVQPVQYVEPVRHACWACCAPPLFPSGSARRPSPSPGFSLTTVFMALFVLLPPDAVGTMFMLEYIRALTYAPTIPLIWAMFADVADYAEWKTGRRTTGVIYATILFGLKTGLSLGGAIAGWLLSGYGYRANAVQTRRSAARHPHDHQPVSQPSYSSS